MAFQILINMIVAGTWMFLKNDWSFPSFFVGFFWGLVLLYLMRRIIPGRFYFSRVLAACTLFFLFLKELLMANISVIRDITRPKLDIQPGIFALPTELKSDWEITLLSILITLTPGTIVMDISDDNKILYIHAINMADADEAIAAIKNSFEKAIMEVTR